MTNSKREFTVKTFCPDTGHRDEERNLTWREAKTEAEVMGFGGRRVVYIVNQATGTETQWA